MPERYAEVAQALGAEAAGGHEAQAAAGISRVFELCQQCGIPDQMRRYGVDQADIRAWPRRP